MLGVLGYQRPFIRGFVHIAKLLTELTKKKTPFKWTQECTDALDKLIKIVTSKPVLACPDQNKPFETVMVTLQMFPPVTPQRVYL